MKKSFFSLLFIAVGLAVFAQNKNLSVEDIWYSRTFSTDYVSGLNSMNDGLHYTSLEQNNGATEIVKYTYKDGKKVAVIASTVDLPAGVSIDDYTFSADEKKLLIASDDEAIYRRSSKAIYYVYDITSKATTPLCSPKMGKVSQATFSPDGTKVSFVYANNLYYKDIASDKQVKITTDGEFNKIINGAVDWVYEEEFGFAQGHYWSPSNDFIAYYKFDESDVVEFNMAMYYNQLYPHQYKFKYPKAGEKNSLVNIYVYNLKNSNNQKVMLKMDAEQYIPRIKWTDGDNDLCILKMNRHQNDLKFYIAHAGYTKSLAIKADEIYHETSKTFIDINDNLIFLDGGQKFFWNSKKDGYNHIYLINRDGSEKQLTKGSWDIIDFIGYDTKRKRVLFTSAENGPLEKQVYAVDLKGKKKTLIGKTGNNDPDFSEGFNYIMNYHTDANNPYVITLHNADGKLVRELVDNKALKATMESFDFQEKTFFTFDNDAGVPLNGWMIKPPNFDESKQYPVLFAIYGGPGSNRVSNSFDGRSYYWHQMLAQKGIIVACVDPRGTMYRGKEFEHSTYMNLGKLETEDMISAAKYMGNMPYVDKDRIGIQGWSYGGYLSSLCMTKGADYFKAGIAVAPVTNWRYYDSIYTERFMRTPQENASGYDDNSPINHVDKLKGAYLLIHGSADDNVHYQNTMEMINALVAANKEFDLMIYPDKNHSIYGGTTRLHLFQKMTDFLLENL